MTAKARARQLIRPMALPRPTLHATVAFEQLGLVTCNWDACEANSQRAARARSKAVQDVSLAGNVAGKVADTLGCRPLVTRPERHEGCCC